MYRSLRVFSLATCLTFFALAFPAHAAQIQMLPPVTEATKADASPSVCPNGSGSGVLTWDGQYPIACASGVTASGGNLAATAGYVQVGNPNTSTTNVPCDAAHVGAIKFDPVAKFLGCDGAYWTSLSQQGTNITVFNAVGTYNWTVPANVTKIEVEVWGGGGGASGGNGGTGGGGGYALGDFSVIPGATYAISVGGGGESAMYPAFAGDGAASSFGNLIGATGGIGGQGGGGAGGAGYGGQLNINGGYGMDLGANTTFGGAPNTDYAGIPGGAAPRGGPGGGFAGSSGPSGGSMDGKQPGGGGGGTADDAGNGAAGAVLVRY